MKQIVHAVSPAAGTGFGVFPAKQTLPWFSSQLASADAADVGQAEMTAFAWLCFIVYYQYINIEEASQCVGFFCGNSRFFNFDSK